jgi:catechol 2,3-dioxygenase-like lactoylglutathione lyase family enzyme
MREPDTNRRKQMSTDFKLEAVVIPVTDVDKAKAFYQKLEWRLDADFAFDNGFRVVQFTPPGSPASVQFGTKSPRPNPARHRVST